MTDKISIPERHQEFCKAVARLCREYDITRAGLTYSPGFDDAWLGDIAMSWAQGRHGEDSGKLTISSTFRVWTELDQE